MRTNLGTHFRRYFFKDGVELELLESKDDIEGASLHELLQAEFGLEVWPLTPTMRDYSNFSV